LIHKEYLAALPLSWESWVSDRSAGKPTIQIALPPRFTGAADRIGGSARNGYYWGSDWAEKFQDAAIPPVPTFDEEMSSVAERARKLVGKVRCGRKFEPAHPFVAKLLGYDEERRKEFAKWRSNYYARITLIVLSPLLLTSQLRRCSRRCVQRQI
jgi:hypothetical protein